MRQRSKMSISTRNRVYTAGSVGFVIIVLFFVVCWAAPSWNRDYAGWSTCAGCHDKITTQWKSSSHALAFESLQKSSQQNLPACIPCHVTGYERPGGFIDIELTPDLIGVQCEECHGPGGNHAAAPSKANTTVNPGIETCRKCHTPGQDPNFDYQKKVRNIHSAKGSGAKVIQNEKLTATPQRFNFGVVDEGVPATTTVTLKNIGDTPVVITDMKSN